MKNLNGFILILLALCLCLPFAVSCGDDDDDDDSDSGDDDDDSGGDCQTVGGKLNDCVADCGFEWDCINNCYQQYYEATLDACEYFGPCHEGCWDVYQDTWPTCTDEQCKSTAINDLGVCTTECG